MLHSLSNYYHSLLKLAPILLYLTDIAAYNHTLITNAVKQDKNRFPRYKYLSHMQTNTATRLLIFL